MEKQLMAFAGTQAGSVVIAVGLGVVAVPYAIKYLVKAAEQQALPYAAMLGSSIGDRISAHGKATAEALKKLEAETWHEANPDVTQQDLDIPGGIQEYFQKVGLPASSHLVAYADKEALSVFQHSGEWNLYGTRKINKQQYWLVVPKGIRVYVKFDTKVYDPDTYPERCQPQGEEWEHDPDCYNIIKEQFLLTPSAWP